MSEENPYTELDDAGFLRYLAQNDYMIDSNFLPEGANLNIVADRVEHTNKLLVEQTKKAIQAAFDLREAKRERDAVRREMCFEQSMVTNLTMEQIAETRGWDCFETQKREEAMDRLAKFDEENGLQ